MRTYFLGTQTLYYILVGSKVSRFIILTGTHRVVSVFVPSIDSYLQG